MLVFNCWSTTPFLSGGGRYRPQRLQMGNFSGVETGSGKGVRLNYYVLLVLANSSMARGAANDIIIVLFSIKFRLINIDTQRYFLARSLSRNPPLGGSVAWKTSALPPGRNIISRPRRVAVGVGGGINGEFLVNIARLGTHLDQGRSVTSCGGGSLR